MKWISILFMALILVASGCQRRSRARVPSLPPPAAAPSPVVVTLDNANRAFNQRNYLEAVRSYEEYLKLDARGAHRDEALFRLGLIYATVENPGHDWIRSTLFLKRLVSEHPDSPLTTPANVIIGLYSEVTQLRADSQARDQRIRQLSTELDRLKKIDAERRKLP